MLYQNEIYHSPKFDYFGIMPRNTIVQNNREKRNWSSTKNPTGIDSAPKELPYYDSTWSWDQLITTFWYKKESKTTIKKTFLPIEINLDYLLTTNLFPIFSEL